MKLYICKIGLSHHILPILTQENYCICFQTGNGVKPGKPTDNGQEIANLSTSRIIQMQNK